MSNLLLLVSSNYEVLGFLFLIDMVQHSWVWFIFCMSTVETRNSRISILILLQTSSGNMLVTEMSKIFYGPQVVGEIPLVMVSISGFTNSIFRTLHVSFLFL